MPAPSQPADDPDPPWDPWRAADALDVVVALDPVAALLGGGFAVRRQGRAVVVLDPAQDARRQRAVLAHELVHLERGTTDRHGAPGPWSAVVAREEQLVEREVARRLAPPTAVRVAVRELAAAGEPVTADALAERLDVDPGVAATSLAELAARDPDDT